MRARFIGGPLDGTEQEVRTEVEWIDVYGSTGDGRSVLLAKYGVAAVEQETGDTLFELFDENLAAVERWKQCPPENLRNCVDLHGRSYDELELTPADRELLRGMKVGS